MDAFFGWFAFEARVDSFEATKASRPSFCWLRGEKRGMGSSGMFEKGR